MNFSRILASSGMGIAWKRDKSKITAFNGEKELHFDASTSA